MGIANYSYDYTTTPSATYDAGLRGYRGVVTIPAGATSATVAVNVIDDVATEGQENIQVRLLTRRTDRNGRVIEYLYDGLAQRIQEIWKDGQTVVRTLDFAYNANGALVSAADPDGANGFTYDNAGRLIGTVQSIVGLAPPIALAYSYDANDRRTTTAATLGGTADYRNAFAYDNLGRMTRVEQSSQTGGNAVAAKRVDFAYDAADQWQSITRYADLAGAQLVAQSSYGYDRAGRLTSLSHVQGGNTLAEYGWSYDRASRPTQFVSLVDGTVDYAYDPASQLTVADYDYQVDEDYQYDANGNRTNNGYTVGANNRLLSDGVYAYAYDAEGNRTARFVDVDSSGTLTAGDTSVSEYAWDHRNRLTGVTSRPVYGANPTQTVAYRYDAFNRLVARQIDPDGAGPQAVQSTYYAYDGDQIALEFDGPLAGDLTHRYLWGPAIDQVLADERVGSLLSAGDVLWPLADNLGTVRDLATYDPGTDTTTVVNHRVFDAYGRMTSETNPAVDHLFGFTGRMFDEATGLQNNLNRWHDPAVGRWTSEDPLGFSAGDANLNRYVGNRPLTSIDPTGLAEEETNRSKDRRPPSPSQDVDELLRSNPDVLKTLTEMLHTYYKSFNAAPQGVKPPERFGYIMIEPKTKKPIVVECHSKEAEETSHPFRIWKSGDLRYGPVPEKTKSGWSVDFDKKHTEGQRVISAWHMHPPFPSGEAFPSSDDRKVCAEHAVPDIMMCYLENYREVKVYVIGSDGKEHEYTEHRKEYTDPNR